MKTFIRLSFIIASVLLIRACEEKEEKNRTPEVEISDPEDGTEFEIGDTVTIMVSADDPDGEILEVRLYINEIEVYPVSELSDSYKYDWDTDKEEAGYSTVKTIARDEDGASSSDKITITLVEGEPPIADFIASPTTVIEGDQIHFSDQSTNEPNSWIWDFGDGNTSVEQNPNYTYHISGKFSIQLTATNRFGSSSETKSEYITVNPAITDPELLISSISTDVEAPVIGQEIPFIIEIKNTGYSVADEFTVSMKVQGETDSFFLMTLFDIDAGETIAFEESHVFNIPGIYEIIGSVDTENDIQELDETNNTYSYEIEILTGGDQNTITDPRDGRTYNTVEIGTQVWIAENLAYLPSVNSGATESYTSSCFYVYNYQGSSVSEAKATSEFIDYGVLYNYPAALEGCPSGWHLPTDEEWKQLEMYLGMSQSDADGFGPDRGNNEGGKLKEAGSDYWASPNTGATDELKFRALPGGYRTYWVGTFDYQEETAFFWTSTSDGSDGVYIRQLYHDKETVGKNSRLKSIGASVRCLMD